MAKAKTATKKAVNKKTLARAIKGASGPCAVELTRMVESGRKIQVLGQVRNGKLELDHSSMQELARRFPNAKMSFVAVNAPFDPVGQKSKI